MASDAEHHTVGSHRLGPHVVGQRVVVRHLLPDGRATDVLGVCQNWGPSSAVLETDSGSVEIPFATIVTGKPVPPRASVRQRVPAAAAHRHALALQHGRAAVDLGEWVLRVGPRDGACPSLALGDPGVPLADAVARVGAFHREHGGAPGVVVEPGSPADEAFAEEGWAVVEGSDRLFQVASLATALRAVRGSAVDDARLRVTEGDGHLEVVLDDGAARGRAAFDADWTGLADLRVEPDARRQGLARAVLAELLDWAGSLGATTAWALVDTDDDASLALAGSLGMRTHHAVRTRTAP